MEENERTKNREGLQESDVVVGILTRLDDIEKSIAILSTREAARSKVGFSETTFTLDEIRSLGCDVVHAITKLQKETASAAKKELENILGVGNAELSPFVSAQQVKDILVIKFDLEGFL